MSDVWLRALRSGTKDGPFVFFGARLLAIDVLREFGATVAGAVWVGPRGAEPRTVSVPLLTLFPDEDTGDLQAGGFGATIEAHEAEVDGFLGEHDPAGQATAISTLSLPPHALGGRRSWAPDATLAAMFEAKRAQGALLEATLPWMPGEPAPEILDEVWWAETTARFASDRVVVQRVGASSGGAATWVCPSVEKANALVVGSGGVRVSPFIDGDAVNVSGHVFANGATLVLPPSRQLVVDGPDGQREYRGNVVGGRWTSDLDRLLDDGHRAAGELFRLGYRGSFGLDAIVTGNVARYHDLNARMNGALYALDLDLPVIAGLLVAEGWDRDVEVGAAEAEVRDTVDRWPRARWLLTMRAAEAGTVPAPRPGLYRVDPARPAATRLPRGGPPQPGLVAGDIVLLRSRVASGFAAPAGADVDLADLWCSADLSDELLRRHGDAAYDLILDALLDAP